MIPNSRTTGRVFESRCFGILSLFVKHQCALVHEQPRPLMCQVSSCYSHNLQSVWYRFVLTLYLIRKVSMAPNDAAESLRTFEIVRTIFARMAPSVRKPFVHCSLPNSPERPPNGLPSGSEWMCNIRTYFTRTVSNGFERLELFGFSRKHCCLPNNS
jgi:hypothetical protein